MSTNRFLLFCAFLSVGSACGPIVSLDYGTFEGARDGNLTKFLGVPFARPTARFELPQAPIRLHGLQNAIAFGPACPQQALSPGPISFPNHTVVSEACLTLDVFKPRSAHRHSNLPVFVWLYGGGFEIGASSDNDLRPAVERSIILGEPVVMVAPNYRLSAFGFLAGKEIGDAGLTNLGLRDQILALRWVQKHIHEFGGDPERVVLGGFSAGSISTGLLQTSNKRNSSSLFRGVFMASGFSFPTPTVVDGQGAYDDLVAVNNCTNARDTLDCLRRVPFDAFLATVDKTPNFFSYRSLSERWIPRVDGDVIMRDPVESVARGVFAQMPSMVGDVDDEGTVFAFSSTNVTTDAEFVEYIRSIYFPDATHAQISRLAELYPRNPPKGSPFGTGDANQVTPEFKRIAAFEGDILGTTFRRLFLDHATQSTWSWLSKRGKSTPNLGAFHGSDISMWLPLNATAATDNVAGDALINFINTLDPNRSGAPKPFASTAVVFWPKWITPSEDGPSSLLTFSDPAVINVTADIFRSEAVEYLTSLFLEGFVIPEVGLQEPVLSDDRAQVYVGRPL
ncbi:carotenoid ester lipase precursor [Mycena maculata]|uniref:Carboxylic ester hydrolase n=1 Tax=Mycena maculata TaxID=230809 RepID=A0AAD7NLT2_9AGAR|nr:carotenoid ester lipase precursor [Mycena maculata]